MLSSSIPACSYPWPAGEDATQLSREQRLELLQRLSTSLGRALGRLKRALGIATDDAQDDLVSALTSIHTMLAT